MDNYTKYILEKNNLLMNGGNQTEDEKNKTLKKVLKFLKKFMIKRNMFFPFLTMPMFFGGSIVDENNKLAKEIKKIIKKIYRQHKKYPIIESIDKYLGLVLKEVNNYASKYTVPAAPAAPKTLTVAFSVLDNAATVLGNYISEEKNKTDNYGVQINALDAKKIDIRDEEQKINEHKDEGNNTKEVYLGAYKKITNFIGKVKELKIETYDINVYKAQQEAFVTAMETFTTYVEDNIVNVFSVKEKTEAKAEINSIGDGTSMGTLKNAKDAIADAETKATNINDIITAKASINSILASLTEIKTLITSIKAVYIKLKIKNTKYDTKAQETKTVEQKFGTNNLDLKQYENDYFKNNVTDKIDANNNKITALLKEAIAIKTSADSKNNTYIQESNIMKNVVGGGIGSCTGFKIRPDIIFTATHCCGGGNLIKDSITNLNCMMGSSGFEYDDELVKYVNNFMETYKDQFDDNGEVKGDDGGGLLRPFNDGNNFQNSWPYLDFMILKDKNPEKKYDENDMVVPILPSTSLNTEDKYGGFTFKYAHKEIGKTEMRQLKIDRENYDKNYLRINGESKYKLADGNSGSPVFAIDAKNKYYYYGTVNYGGGEKVWGILHIDQVYSIIVGPTLTKAYKDVLKTRLNDLLSPVSLTGGGNSNAYKIKYLKYKNKYLKLKNKLNK